MPAFTRLTAAPSREFPVSGLDGYVVRYLDGHWYVRVSGVVSYRWNEATQRHDLPAVEENFTIERRATAKQAVAAAYAHARFIRDWPLNNFKHR